MFNYSMGTRIRILNVYDWMEHSAVLCDVCFSFNTICVFKTVEAFNCFLFLLTANRTIRRVSDIDHISSCHQSPSKSIEYTKYIFNRSIQFVIIQRYVITLFLCLYGKRRFTSKTFRLSRHGISFVLTCRSP